MNIRITGSIMLKLAAEQQSRSTVVTMLQVFGIAYPNQCSAQGRPEDHCITDGQTHCDQTARCHQTAVWRSNDGTEVVKKAIRRLHMVAWRSDNAQEFMSHQPHVSVAMQIPRRAAFLEFVAAEQRAAAGQL